MSELTRIDEYTESVLRLLAQRSASLKNLSYITGINEMEFAKTLKFLIDGGYIHNCGFEKEADKTINLKDSYGITLKGKAYIENVDRKTKKERTQKYINIFNASIAFMALIVSILSLLVSLSK